MPKVNFEKLEEQSKKCSHGDISTRLDFTSSDDESFVLDLIQAFPSILKTIRAYESAIEKVREMDVFASLVQSHINPDYPIDLCQEWRSKRDTILKILDDQFNSIEEK